MADTKVLDRALRLRPPKPVNRNSHLSNRITLNPPSIFGAHYSRLLHLGISSAKGIKNHFSVPLPSEGGDQK
jgi:hypothetical protein